MQDVITTLMGNVGTDVELAHGEGWARASFRLGSTPRHLRQGEWVDGETTWLTVNCWGRMAHHVKASLAKGDPVVVHGRMRTVAWLKDGNRQERQVVEATTIGHDLARGTATFVRQAPRVRQADGTTIDLATGQIHDERQLRASVPVVEPDDFEPDDFDDEATGPETELDETGDGVEFEHEMARERELSRV